MIRLKHPQPTIVITNHFPSFNILKMLTEVKENLAALFLANFPLPLTLNPSLFISILHFCTNIHRLIGAPLFTSRYLVIRVSLKAGLTLQAVVTIVTCAVVLIGYFCKKKPCLEKQRSFCGKFGHPLGSVFFFFLFCVTYFFVLKFHLLLILK